MSKLSEEEIIYGVYSLMEGLYNSMLHGNDLHLFNIPKYKMAIQGLLDLYNKEKKKNKKAIKYILKKQSLQYKYALSKIECEELLKLLEERN